jgi:hypothetical protein
MMNHTNGRPSITYRVNIKKVLMPYFEKGFSASFTSKETGFNIKTVSKYFNEWTTEIQDAENADFFGKMRAATLQMIVTYDYQIKETSDLLIGVDKEIENFQNEKKPLPKYLIPLKLDLMKFRASLIEKKAAFMMNHLISLQPHSGDGSDERDMAGNIRRFRPPFKLDFL